MSSLVIRECKTAHFVHEVSVIVLSFSCDPSSVGSVVRISLFIRCTANCNTRHWGSERTWRSSKFSIFPINSNGFLLTFKRTSVAAEIGKRKTLHATNKRVHGTDNTTLETIISNDFSFYPYVAAWAGVIIRKRFYYFQSLHYRWADFEKPLSFNTHTS